MRKLFFGLIILTIVYLGIQWSFIFFSKGHSINYEIKNGKLFEVEEVFKAEQENDRNNYYLKINVDDTVFTYQVFDNFDKQSHIIKNLYYYEDSTYKCIIPLFKNNKFLFDVTCYDGKVYNYYHNIKFPSENLKVFVFNLGQYGYELKEWSNKTKVLESNGSVTLYDNLVNNHYVGLSNYKGVFLINDKIDSVDIFSKDIYQRPISSIVSNLYISADYTGINDFTKFQVVNLVNRNQFDISSSYKISYNTYVLGAVDASLYLYDKDNRIEYEVNLKTRTVSIVGAKDRFIKYYTNGEWMDLDIDDFEDNQVFGSKYKNDYFNGSYNHIVKYGNNSGYYYLFKLNNNKYDVYRVNIQDKSSLTYLFSTTDYNKVVYLDNYIYYLDNNYLKYYSEKTGNRVLLRNTEFEFNKTIKFGVYEK